MDLPAPRDLTKIVLQVQVFHAMLLLPAGAGITCGANQLQDGKVMTKIDLSLTIEEGEGLIPVLKDLKLFEDVLKRLETLLIEESIDESYREDPELMGEIEVKTRIQ